ncbi:UNVERIFIED_CONTAM: hypothetical protein K2H54_067564 [Gekko kuhli]
MLGGTKTAPPIPKMFRINQKDCKLAFANSQVLFFLSFFSFPFVSMSLGGFYGLAGLFVCVHKFQDFFSLYPISRFFSVAQCLQPPPPQFGYVLLCFHINPVEFTLPH